MKIMNEMLSDFFRYAQEEYGLTLRIDETEAPETFYDIFCGLCLEKISDKDS